ncbi:ATpases involved in chromosome partitioning [Clostridium aceticum]|uniref:ATpases involved in chromosome partitioning n=1 Tax=Clostridium aceticum TaxID=84022 RepID=A0A0D8I7F0_9CLOT|nr:MinD/ParA family protein [Clostridium aceticum]AKL95461.1 ATpases involved in chromosome partitioning [Clostridium aceticum]KJF25947.1 ATP-binding protein [Clostridium aceticum]
MMDQATKLRELIKKKNVISNSSIQHNEESQKHARVICITSGKGGVGKTNFTVNLAIALSKQNKRVAIIDADLGLANVDVMLGVIPKFTLLDVVKNNKNITDIMNTGPNGIKIISGGSGILDLVDLSEEHLNILIHQFNKINDFADIILIDTGAGLSKSVVSFVLAAEEVIVVTTSEPTSLTDAYAMIKTIGLQDKNKNIKAVINRVESINEGTVAFEKLKNAAEKFLDIEIEKLGFIVDDYSVSRAVKLQKPFILQYPGSAVSKGIETIALKLMNHSIEEKNTLKSDSFFSKILNLLR